MPGAGEGSTCDDDQVEVLGDDPVGDGGDGGGGGGDDGSGPLMVMVVVVGGRRAVSTLPGL